MQHLANIYLTTTQPIQLILTNIVCQTSCKFFLPKQAACVRHYQLDVATVADLPDACLFFQIAAGEHHNLANNTHAN